MSQAVHFLDQKTPTIDILPALNGQAFFHQFEKNLATKCQLFGLRRVLYNVDSGKLNLP